VELFLGTYDEFLERIGWDEDTTGTSNAQATVPPAEIAYQQSKVENKVEQQKRKKLEKLEAEIMQQEKKLNEIELELSIASQNQNIDKIMDLTKLQDATRKAIEELYKQY